MFFSFSFEAKHIFYAFNGILLFRSCRLVVEQCVFHLMFVDVINDKDYDVDKRARDVDFLKISLRSAERASKENEQEIVWFLFVYRFFFFERK